MSKINRKALVIGQNYRGTEYELPGCENDAKLFTAFFNSFGVPADMHLEMGKDNFVALMKEAASRSSATDIFYLATSGHGTQVEGGPERDGYDEGLVFYTEENGFEVLLDDDFRALVMGFRGTVVTLIDHCYAGGEQRIFRGRPVVHRAIARGTFPNPGRQIGFSITSKTKFYLLAACAESETAADLGTSGEFTGALMDAFKRAGRKGTVGSIMSLAKSLCKDQTPTLLCENGNKLRKLFN